MPVLRVPGAVLSRRFFATRGVLLVMKTLKDERYVVIKAYKCTVSEIWRDSFVLAYIARTSYPYIQSLPTLWYHKTMMKTPTSPFYAANTLNHLPILYSPPPPPPPTSHGIKHNPIHTQPPHLHSHHIPTPTNPPTWSPTSPQFPLPPSWTPPPCTPKLEIPSSALRTAWRQGERNILTCKQTPVDDHELPQKCTVHNMDRSMLTCTIIYTVPHGRKFGREFNSAAWRIMNAPPN